MSSQEIVLASDQQQAIIQTSGREFLPAMTMDLAVQRRSMVVEFTKQIMVDGQDFGTIPGTNKPSLLKPGAEKLCNFFGLEPEFIDVEKSLDWTGEDHGGEPFIYYHYRCRLMKHDRCFGAGEGSCNSWESKYRYRWVSEDSPLLAPYRDKLDTLPKRGGTITEPAFAIEKGETSGRYGKPAEHWQRFRDAIAAGTARKVTRKTKAGKNMDAWEIGGEEYRIPNPDIADIANTVMKMGQKRALVAATLIATSASEFFTQDVEDMPGFGQPLSDFAPIDTGGHRPGTQAAANHVAETKIAQMSAQQAQPDSQPVESTVARGASAAGPPEPAANNDGGGSLPSSGDAPAVEPAVLDMWQRMRSIKAVCEEFANLKTQIVEASGTDEMYYLILKNHGIEHANQCKNAQTARQCVRALWQHLQIRLAKAADTAQGGLFQASDDDLPAELGGAK